MKHYKDSSPAETVARIKRILGGLGILPEEKRYSCAGFHSCRVEDPRIGCGTNGKGASEELSLASGYGEFMERLQNDALVGRLYDKFDNRPEDAFQSWPDERLVSQEEALAAMPCLVKDVTYAFISEDEAQTEGEIQEQAVAFLKQQLLDQVVMLPYYQVGTGACTMVPDDIVSFVNATNGFSSGNTPEEALVEGMSEICERYAKYRILEDELCPPKIPLAFIQEHCPAQAAMIERIKQEAGQKVVVMDASLGYGLPVVGAVFIDQERGRYRLKFGSHPTFAVALERCMTEHFQGIDAGKAGSVNGFLASWDGITRAGAHNLEYVPFIFKSDCGPVPDKVFMQEPSWDFEPWGLLDDYTNKAGARCLAHLLKEVGGDVYVRSTGFLGFPSFHVYVPGISAMPKSQGDALLKLSQTLETLGNEVVFALSEYERGNLQAAARLLMRAGGARHRCAAQELLCREEGMPKEQRDELLELFYGSGSLAYVKACWRAEDARSALIAFQERENALLGIRPKRSVASTNREHADERHELFLRLKERKAANPIDQSAVQDILG